ncbi:MAG TPA: hypothetical protein VGJ57_10640 [Nitrospirales bacterium]|jgi:hypothetical protein
MRVPRRFVLAFLLCFLLAGAAHPAEKSTNQNNLHHSRPPAIKGNPSIDPAAPPRIGEPGRLLLSCMRPGESQPVEMYASARTFDEGRQSFFLRRLNQAGEELFYPLHGHFLDGGASGIFMIHDGKGMRRQEILQIDQTVNMGLVFLQTTTDGLQAVLNVYAESENSPGALKDLEQWSCRWGVEARRSSLGKDHVRAEPNTGARPPSHWFQESNTKLLECTASGPTGTYRIEVLGSTIWPGHLGFLVVRAPGNQPVGYNVHLLEGPGRLLLHAHSYPHRTRVRMLDTMEETETVIGGLLLSKTENGYTGWIGLVSSAADPMNTSFSRDATVADYASLGHAVIPPLPVACR